MNHIILGIAFNVLMIMWLVQAVFLTRAGDYPAKSYDMLWAILSYMMSRHHFNMWRKS